MEAQQRYFPDPPEQAYRNPVLLSPLAHPLLDNFAGEKTSAGEALFTRVSSHRRTSPYVRSAHSVRHFLAFRSGKG